MRSLVLALVWFLAGLCLTASVASAGPNAGGVLWVHDTGVEWSTSPPMPPMTPPPTNCAEVDNQQDADGVDRIWKVYAAFPEGSGPQLKSTGWRTEFPEDILYAYITMDSAGCGGPDSATWVGSPGFPTHPGEVWLTFQSPRHSTVVELFYFTGAAFAGNSGAPPPTWCTAPRYSLTERVFLDDAVPPNEDLILGYGCLGFGQAGHTPCPQPPTGCCCDQETGSSSITTQAGCLPPSVWLGADVPCNSLTCPPLGACCDHATGDCTFISQAACLALGWWFEWLGAGVSCIEEVNCEPWGCCCDYYSGGSSVITTQAACPAPFVWLGPGVGCDSCLPIGCCCDRSTGQSMMTTQADCQFEWLGAGVTCTAENCPPVGACCDFTTGECTLTTPAACMFEWLGAGVPCDPNPCLPGACCDIVNGSCSMTLASGCLPPAIWLGAGVPCSECAQLGACCDLATSVCTTTLDDRCEGSSVVWLGVGVPCHPNPCPLLGLCCCPWSCTVTAEPDCLAPCIWHAFSPGWDGCDPNPCPPPEPTGACCFPVGLCQVTTQAACAGTWIEGALCYPDPCPAACCFPDGHCEMLTQATCAVGAGVWLMGVTCPPNPCLLLGACCNDTTGVCTVTLHDECGTGSTFHSEWGTCAPNLCPPPPTTGGCCNPIIGFPLGCTITTQANCQFIWLGDVPCDAVTCPPPAVLGVCCNSAVGPPADCTITTELACLFVWHPDWPLICDPDPCNPMPPTGSCCYPNGTCEVTTQVACTATWLLGGLCDPNTCEPPPAQGACCDHLTGNCAITTQTACGFDWLGAGVPCDLTTCVPPTPTERTSWGQIKNTYR